MTVWRALVLAAVLTLASWAVVQGGIFWGAKNVPAGAGMPDAEAVSDVDLFRFDSFYYYSIATRGYEFNGDLYSSPNIVFAPLYPLLVRAVAPLFGGDALVAGFALNKFLLFGALLCLLLFLEPIFGLVAAFWILFGAVTSAGAYTFHAYYSESTMLLCLGVCLLAWQRQWLGTLAAASCALGASRITALPISGLYAGALLWRGWRWSSPRLGIYALIALGGAAGYLCFIEARFGNPFTLFPAVQTASWGKFHPPTDWWQLLTGGYLWRYWGSAFDRGLAGWRDIKTVNLAWTTLALFSCLYLIVRWRRELWAWVFLLYFAFIYATDSSSEYLISAHRFFTLMVPIFMAFAELHDWIERWVSQSAANAAITLLLELNLAYGIFYAGYFNQGRWYYF